MHPRVHGRRDLRTMTKVNRDLPQCLQAVKGGERAPNLT